MSSTALIAVCEWDDASFPAASGHGVVLAEFYMPWCSQCETQRHELMSIAPSLAAQFTLGRLDAEGAPLTVEKYGIDSVPTLILLKGGALYARFVGIQRADTLEQAVSALL